MTGVLRQVALLALMLLVGCFVEPLDPAGKKCRDSEPRCAAGFTCGPEGLCVAGLLPTSCESDADCTGPCDVGRCESGVCGLVSPGTPSKQQTLFDCKVSVCGQDAITDLPDSADLWRDDNLCTLESCVEGVRSVVFAAQGTRCAGPNSGCTGEGVCGLECNGSNPELEDSACPSELSRCLLGTCVPPTCLNGALDLGEPDEDCGGPCLPCADGSLCGSPNDCQSKVCAGERCVSSCNDGVSNAGEASADCGGTSQCAKCARGAPCMADSDCASGRCIGVCASP